jgi:hypothetical protein
VVQASVRFGSKAVKAFSLVEEAFDVCFWSPAAINIAEEYV